MDGSSIGVVPSTPSGIQRAHSCDMPDPEVPVAEETPPETETETEVATATETQTEPEPETEPESEAGSEAPKSKTMIAIIAALVVLALIAGGVLLARKKSAPAPKKAASVKIEATLPLETFVVNLAGDERSYLRVTMTLGLAHPLVKEKQETGLPVPAVRDTILTVLSTAHPAELLQPEGKAQLKAQVLQALQARLPEMDIKEVYFTEFLVQM